ncbi:MAG: hypothetical protein JRH20_25055 [Deltaproteobacteria bacterium]|nr:hypothetical protein [Deltaproteobacteria bacterium]
MPLFVDIHSHILPGLDDGPTDLATSLELVQGLHALGFGIFHPTPHQKARAWAPTVEQRQQASEELRQALAKNGLELEIRQAGGENMWDDLFLERHPSCAFPCYEGDKAFLIEFTPHLLPPALPEQLFRFRVAGLLPVIAHVERYPSLVKKEAALEALEGKAALLVNLSSLGGLGGFGQKRLARQLVKKRQVHAVASDAHGDPDLHYGRKGLHWLERQLHPTEIEALLCENPIRILQGEIPE